MLPRAIRPMALLKPLYYLKGVIYYCNLQQLFSAVFIDEIECLSILALMCVSCSGSSDMKYGLGHYGWG